MKYRNSINDMVAKTNLPKRVMRYVVDRGISPVDRNTSSSGPGIPRWINPKETFFMVVATALIHYGVKAKLVTALFDDENIQPFYEFFEELELYKSASLDLSEGVYFRLRVERKQGTAQPFENKWLWIREYGETEPAMEKAYKPLLVTSLDLMSLYLRIK